jgi:thymidylate synthase (FAD)
MKLINPSVQLLEQGPGLQGIYKQIELAGRTCYKSEDKITEDSAEKFVQRMINSKHYAMLEHGTVYLTVPGESEPNEIGQCSYIPIEKGNYSMNAYSKRDFEHFDQKPNEVQSEFCKVIPRTRKHITTNLRVLVENGWLDDLQYITEPTEFHERRYTFRIITSIGITRELIRHRVFSFANESTRYCNYSKDKFGGELTFIKPYWLQDSDSAESVTFFTSLEQSERAYNKLTEMGVAAQAAREVLPLATKSEIIMTGFKSDWDRFLDIRLHQSTGPVHPDMLVIANMIDKQLP